MPTDDTELARIAAIEATREATDLLDDAGARLRETIAEARVFRIPIQPPGAETPPTAPVHELAGQAAIDAGIAALCASDYRDHQHPMATLGCPGVLAVDSDIGELVRAVNAAKQTLRTAMATMGTPQWRFWRDRTPVWSRLNRLQIYRDWHMFEAPVRQVGMSWAGHTHGIEQLRINDLLGRLKDQHRRSGHPNAANEIARLAGFDPTEVVVIRRPIAPTPLVNVAFSGGARKPIKTSLPLIVPAPMPVISPLRDFDIDARNAPRSDRAIEDVPLVAYCHAWRYLPAYRFNLPASPVSARVIALGDNLVVRVPKQPDTVIATRDARRLSALVGLAAEARGPLTGEPPLDDTRQVRAVAVNRVHAYLVGAAERVWRVPLNDLRDLANTQAA